MEDIVGNIVTYLVIICLQEYRPNLSLAGLIWTLAGDEIYEVQNNLLDGIVYWDEEIPKDTNRFIKLNREDIRHSANC